MFFWRRDVSERSDHIAWCRGRALEYLDKRQGDMALASFVSDMGKLAAAANALQPITLAEGQRAALTGDLDALRRWIEGFS